MHPMIDQLLVVQEFHIKMIRLLKVKSQRRKELQEIQMLRSDLRAQFEAKEKEIQSYDREIKRG